MPGATTTARASKPTVVVDSPSGSTVDSINPSSASPSRTSVSTTALFAARICTAVGASPACTCRSLSVTSHRGNR